MTRGEKKRRKPIDTSSIPMYEQFGAEGKGEYILCKPQCLSVYVTSWKYVTIIYDH